MDAMTLYVGACRYYFGRTTYAVADFCNGLVADWLTLPADVRRVIQYDVDTEFEKDDAARREGLDWRPLGHDEDRKSWERVRKLWTP